jgi:benzodiazapine receptor
MLLLFIAACFAVAETGAIFTGKLATIWYHHQIKPKWTAIAWVFGPARTALYLMMAIAAWLAWRRLGFGGAAGALRPFALQLGLNAL